MKDSRDFDFVAGAIRMVVEGKLTSISLALSCLLFFTLVNRVCAQAVPPDEQNFCNAFPSLQQALQRQPEEPSGNPLKQEQQVENAAKQSVHAFMEAARWKSSSQSAKGWVGELNSITESHAWGDFVGVTVKLQCGEIIVGVPEGAVQEWSSDRVDPVAQKCVDSGDPYIGSDKPLFKTLTKLDIGQRVKFTGRFCKVPGSVNSNVIYFTFSMMSAQP